MSNIKKYKLTSHGKELEITLAKHKYLDNNTLAIQMYCHQDENSEPYGMLTVNLPYSSKLPDNCAFLNVNLSENIDMPKWVKENKLGIFIGIEEKSGFVTYPAYFFYDNIY